ncbi:hypothetical protein VTJ83DRAFT_4604 [Remersonia thermophila]|uniref:Uncharacterized protein n=1 Tax=Remersonia thermophila TaxID=72144 RepID=A0ABR4DAM8_9PEZI
MSRSPGSSAGFGVLPIVEVPASSSDAAGLVIADMGVPMVGLHVLWEWELERGCVCFETCRDGRTAACFGVRCDGPREVFLQACKPLLVSPNDEERCRPDYDTRGDCHQHNNDNACRPSQRPNSAGSARSCSVRR